MKIVRALSSAFCFLGLCCFVPAHVHAQAANPALGVVVKSSAAHIGNAAASDGATVYSGDSLSTDDNGAIQVRVGTLSFELQSNSAAHIYRAPYGAIVELDRGSAIYNTPGGHENLVIVASDVRVTPVLSLSDFGSVTIDDPCKVTVNSQRGQVDVHVGSESKLVEQGKAYRVLAENEISYRDYLSPDDNDYHNHHDHKPCAAMQMAKGHPPIAAGQSRFLYVAAGTVALLTAWGIKEAFESPNRP
jgi:hypothetical protein